MPPKENFDAPDKYYSTALHELGHWTGEEKRLNREFGPFGSEPYARTGETLFPKELSRVVKATMVMCGMYTESGRVVVRIGLPTKSGVGGGIISLVPESAGIGIYGPALNKAGSSIAGLALLERISNAMNASIF